MSKIIHVAAENGNYRESLRSTIESFHIGDVVVASTEGADGTGAVRDSSPEILIVSTSAGEDTVEHLRWYRDAAPRAHIIGFAFNDAEADGLRNAGIETVVSSKVTRARMIAVLKAVDHRTPE